MADAIGYTVLRKAVSLARVQQAAAAIDSGLTALVARDKFTEFQVPTVGYAVRDEFIKNGKAALLDFFAPKEVPEMPKSINIGTFHSTSPDPSKPKTGGRGQVYVTIALTDLNSESGWFVLLEGSHQQKPESTPASEWKEASLNLSAGDAVVWRGDLAYLHSPGGGGKFETLVYEIRE